MKKPLFTDCLVANFLGRIFLKLDMIEDMGTPRDSLKSFFI